MSIITTIYKKSGFVPFSLNISWNESKQKKEVKNIPSFITIEKYDNTKIIKSYNGMGLRTGMKLPTLKNQTQDYYMIALDIDNKQDDNKLNGLIKWTEIMIINNFPSIEAIKTPIQKTQSGGYHYLFKVNQQQLNIIGASITDLNIDGQKYSIDIKAINQFIFCEPTKINDKRFYKWIKSPEKTPIMILPDFIYNLILNHHNIKTLQAVSAKTKTIVKNNTTVNDVTNTNVKEDEEKITTVNNLNKLVELVNVNRFDNYTDWIKLGAIIKFCNLPFEIFDKKSQTSKKYDKNETIKKWNSFTKSKKVKSYEAGLKYFAKLDNPEAYNILYNEQNLQKLEINDEYEMIKLNQKYLLELDDNLSKSTTIFTNTVEKFTTDKNIKSLNIQSPYGTGKTQFLKKYIAKYNPERILWLSYRITYTDDIMNEFKQFKFGSYLKRQYNSNRLICQLESLLNLQCDDDFLDEDEICQLIPQYDLIVIDEIESILNQFDSTTFKGRSRDVFDFLLNIIKVSSKVITLDGDLNNRSLKYMANFGQMLNIKNEYSQSELTFNLTQNRILFIEQLLKAIEIAQQLKKKIGICSMSKTECINMYNIINESKPNLKILIIHGDIGDDVKIELSDINTNIKNYDVMIYSPTIEAGVNISNDCFYQLFCILSDGSTSQRSFLQMTARIRNLENPDILILNECFKMNQTSNFWNYDDVKPMLSYIKDFQFTSKYVEKDNQIFMVKSLSPYDENYLHNRIERLNKNKYYFLPLLKVLCQRKSIKFVMSDEPLKKPMKKDVLEILQNVIDAKDATYEEYMTAIKRQNQRLATTEDKFIIKKFSLKKMLGLDFLNMDILKTYNNKTSLIHNYCALIDIQNIRDTTDNTKNENITKTLIVTRVLNELGYKNLMDTQQIIETQFDIGLEKLKNGIFNFEQSDIKKLFGMTKLQQNLATKKSMLGFINVLLKNFNIQIVSIRKSKNEKKISFYFIEHLNYIKEILTYKIEKGFKINDTSNLFIPVSTFELKELYIKPDIKIT
jgi:hypothetical protein